MNRDAMAGAVTIIVDDERFELSDELAQEVANHLWKGLERGAVTAAARLSTAIYKTGGPAEEAVFPPYEWVAVLDALTVLGARPA
jgi:hypothetical protein